MSFEDSIKKAAEALGQFIDTTETKEKVIPFKKKGEAPAQTEHDRLREDAVNFYLVIGEAANTLPHLYDGDMQRSYQVVLNSLILVMGEMLANMTDADGDRVLDEFIVSVKEARRVM